LLVRVAMRGEPAAGRVLVYQAGVRHEFREAARGGGAQRQRVECERHARPVTVGERIA
jgi:hypothetical protein